MIKTEFEFAYDYACFVQATTLFASLRLMIRLKIGIKMPNVKFCHRVAALVVFVILCISTPSYANDKIKQAIRNYEARMEVERAKVLDAFEKENRIAERSRNDKQITWLNNVKHAWLDSELIVSERGSLQFFSGATETFDLKDFNLAKGFKRVDKRLLSNEGDANIRLSKPAKAAYFRGLVESKNNFAIQLNRSSASLEKDIAIIIGGWNNRKSEIHFDGEMLVTKPVGMPPRWLCEVYYENQVVCVYANGIELMKARTPRPLQFDLASISVSHKAATTVHSPIFKFK